MIKSFYEAYGEKSLKEIFSDWEPRPLDYIADSWLNFPSETFQKWCLNFPRHSFDAIPPDSSFKIQPSFLISQSHRVWLSSKKLKEIAHPYDSILDLGSFPFSVPLALRDFYRHEGEITASLIQPINDNEISILSGYNILLDSVDLDPYVVDIHRGSSLPRMLKAPDQSQDVVSMFHVIEHLYHPMLALKEASRVLRKNGKILITTDNAMMLNTLQNYVSGYGYIFEPAQGTAAMTVHDWRGHVRFFTVNDIIAMLEESGFIIEDFGFNEVFYNIIFDNYFVESRPFLPNYKKEIIRNYPQFSNDLWITASKK
jgi:SAM-dependent methyltransferase